VYGDRGPCVLPKTEVRHAVGCMCVHHYWWASIQGHAAALLCHPAISTGAHSRGPARLTA
jgi:hypothetical protein